MPRSLQACSLSLISRFLILGLAVTLPLSLRAADEPKSGKPAELPLIAPDKAGDNIGKECQVEFKVLSANLKNEKSPCFLNSKGNFKDKDNFQVVIFAKYLPIFKEAKIDDPSLHYAGKTIRVQGKIEIHKEKPEIEVRSPEQITIVEEKSAKQDLPATKTPPAAKKPAK